MLFECITLSPPHMATESDEESQEKSITSVKSNDNDNGDTENEFSKKELLYNDNSTNDESNEINESSFIDDLGLPAELNLPTFIKLTDEYNFIVDIFTICTSQEPTERPDAETVLSILKKNIIEIN